MKVSIKNVEKTVGVLILKRTLYGVECTVTFTEEEKAIIKERNLGELVILERKPPADVDAEAHEERHVALKVATAVWKGRDANHFHLTPNKLLRGPETYWMNSVVNCKNYVLDLKEALTLLKDGIADSRDKSEDETFEL